MVFSLDQFKTDFKLIIGVTSEDQTFTYLMLINVKNWLNQVEVKDLMFEIRKWGLVLAEFGHGKSKLEVWDREMSTNFAKIVFAKC